MELKPAGKSGKVKAQIGETMLLSRYVAEARRAAKDAENSAQRAETVLINKQDKLVSGVNIKTINDQDVLGSGNIVISGNGSSIAIDSELSDTSVNAVQNRVITGAVREIERALNAPPPIGLGMTGATGGQVPVVKTVDENGVPTSYEPGAGGGGQEIEVSDTEPTNPSVDVWFQEQQQGTPVEVYTVPEINDMIAPAETSPTQAAHHVGEYIICVINGQAKLYKVIAEISPGETLNPGQGGNIEEVSIGSLMTVKKETYTYTSNNYVTLRIDEFSGRNILLLNWLITSGGNGRLVFFGINSPAYPGYLFKLLDYANTGGLTPMPNTTVTIKFTFIEF